MNRFLYLSLACQSMRKNYRVYIPFLAGTILMTSMIYTMISLASAPAVLDGALGQKSMQITLELGSKVIEFFTLIFYLYLCTVWNRQRQKENGLFSILGMEKRQLIRITAWQMLLSCIASILIGIALGILLEKIFSLIIALLLGNDPSLGFHVSFPAMMETAVWTGASYLMIFVLSVIGLLRKNPLELSRSTSAGEKKIRSRNNKQDCDEKPDEGFNGVHNQLCDRIADRQADDAKQRKDPAGTYLLFIFGLTALLSIMQKKKGYYYTTKHFISVSSMRYRLRRSAAAMANIAILSTMILVTLSTTLCLMLGISQEIQNVYARDVKVQFKDGSLITDTRQTETQLASAAKQADKEDA